MDDAERIWVEQARRRDAAAFGRLIRRYERAALAVAFSVVGDRGEAGDVTQEAFVRAWNRLPDLKEPNKFPSWLCGIVRNLAVDFRRRAKPTASLGNFERAAGLDPADALSRKEAFDRLGAAIAELDEISRSVVALRYYDGLSSREIGDLLELAPTAVDMRLSRARRQLRDRLQAADAAVM